MVSIDGDTTVPLPAALELGVGFHRVRALCSDMATETLELLINPGALVTLRVCDSDGR